ncbi:MAG: radical SAM family heme chaperone HemW [Flavitalea sp.]
MAGIYIHIPYCKKACHYCNFHFSTSLQTKNEFVPALLKEISLRKDFLQQEKIETIYFGGGTPSLLDAVELKAVMEKIREDFAVSEDAELTLEANPDDITREKLRDWVSLGINRLSIGVQSFFEEDLLWMNRAHNADQAQNCIRIAQQEGIANLTIDLIYGTPGLTDEKWLMNLEKVKELGVQHVSCYALTVEPKTALDLMIQKGKKENITPEKQASHFLLLMDWAARNGFEHYEISNFARPGFRSRHNSAYWSGATYLGLGPSAHSFDGKSRQWNVSNNSLYIKSIEGGVLPLEEEQLTEIQQLNEYIMTSLRTMEGTNLNRIAEKFGAQWEQLVRKESGRYLSTGKLELINNRLVLTREGKLFADGIAADLFVGI